ncbi:MAG: MFS transporter, partial [Myxococcota bacterium]|nr:MFS transporter [Myxococcota bacterium]
MASAPGESLIGKFLVLRGAARELWLILAAKVLTITAYALVGTSTLGLWLSADLKLSDEGAGLVIAGWSSALTIFTVMVGSLVDAIGIRRSLLIGFGLCVLARTTLSFATSPWLALLLGLLPLALGEALQTPVMVAAVKRFSTTRQRSIAYSIYYSMMN